MSGTAGESGPSNPAQQALERFRTLGTPSQPRRRSPDVVREARAIVCDLIEWEMHAADGDRYGRACDKYGADRVQAALEAIQNELRRKGANP